MRVQDVAFSSRCESTVMRFIRDSDEIIGCVAWLTNRQIIDELRRLHRCRITVTADVVHNRPHLGLQSIGARQVGVGRGRYRALMHHKFMVRLNRGRPTHVLMGSYNFTRRSNANLGESIVVIACGETARAFAEEAERVFADSRPIRYYHGRR